MGDILLVSTNNSVIITDNSMLIAGNDPTEATGNITLNAEQDIIIGDEVTIRSGENNATGDINLIADAAGSDGAGSDDVISIGRDSFIMANGGSVNLSASNGQITVENNTSIIAEQDITLVAESSIDTNATLAPEGLLDIQSGESGNPDGEGSFRLGPNGTIDINTSLVFGAADGVHSRVRIDRAASGPADLLTIDGRVNSLGDIIFDLDGVDSGGLNLDTSVSLTGTLNANGKVTVFTQNNQGFTGGGTVNAEQVFISVDGSGEISLESITVDEWARLDSELGNITIDGPVNVNMNRGTDTLVMPTVNSQTITVADATEFRLGDIINVGVDTDITITDIDFDTNTITQAGNWTAGTLADTAVMITDSSARDAFAIITTGDVIVNGNVTGNSVAALNLAIDPNAVTLKGTIHVTGDIDVHAADNIVISGMLQSDEGRIIIRADDDGSAFPGNAGADGVGDLVMTSGQCTHCQEWTRRCEW